MNFINHSKQYFYVDLNISWQYLGQPKSQLIPTKIWDKAVLNWKLEPGKIISSGGPP